MLATTGLEHIRQLAGIAGLRVREQDADALSRWSAERMRKLDLSGFEQYARLLAEDSTAGRRERELLTVQSSTGESYFFRDQGQFELLAAKFLPELIERRVEKRTLHLWSAGCATGEEAYSLAMLIDELAPRLVGWRVLILGTDINSDALEKARRGAYRNWSFRALDEERKRRYFRLQGDEWRIDPRLRDRVSFRNVDLVRDRFPGTEAAPHDFDLILCRNVFIYLDAHSVSSITAKFAEALADDGYLVCAHSELFGHATAPLRMRMFAQSAVFQKTAQPATETSPGDALAQMREPSITALRPPNIDRPAPPGAHRTPPAERAATPAEACARLMQAAWRHADRGRPEEAEQDCREALAVAAFDPRPYYLLAQIAQERGEQMQARALLTKVIYLDPFFIAAYLELGALHARAGDNERARRMYATARSALAKLAPHSVIAPYSDSTAADILAYVERLLVAPAAAATSGMMGRARPYQNA